MATQQSDNYYVQVSESIKSVYELTTRVDERVKSIIKKQDEMDTKFSSYLDRHSDLDGRVRVIEAKKDPPFMKTVDDLNRKLNNLQTRIQMCEMGLARTESKWAKVFDYIIKFIWMIVVAYLLYALGIK